MANSGLPFARLPDFNDLLRELRKREQTPSVWHCDYCGADYDERPEACGNCGNRNLRPPEAPESTEGDAVVDLADQLDIAFLRGLRR